MQGLDVSRIVDVTVNLAPLAIPQAGRSLLILGDSDVIDTGEAIRSYSGLTGVATDFLTTSPEYLAASLYFGQTPRPNNLFIGRWARVATSGVLIGGPLNTTQQLISAWTGITNGGFHIAVDGGASTNVTGLNFSGATNLNGVASIIQTAVRALAGGFALVTVTWNGFYFKIESGTTGTASVVSYLTAPTAGTDISGQLLMTALTATRNVTGIAAETPVTCVARVDGRGWRGVMFAASVMPVDADRLAVAGYIQGATVPHVYGITSNAATILDPANTSDIASQLSLADYTRTFIQYSNSNPYAIASEFGRLVTVDYNGSNTTITMKFKQEPGVTPEILTSTQADTLKAKRCNVYAIYTNGASIVQEGVMSGQAYIDEIEGLDWLAEAIQTDLFNVLYQAPKIPQTDPGVHVLLTACENRLNQAVNNGLAAPGRWNAPGFGKLVQGQLLPKGWYIFADSVDNQPQTDREQRIAPLIQIAVKLAGAIHFVNAQINVNRGWLALLSAGAAMQMLFGGMLA